MDFSSSLSVTGGAIRQGRRGARVRCGAAERTKNYGGPGWVRRLAEEKRCVI